MKQQMLSKGPVEVGKIICSYKTVHISMGYFAAMHLHVTYDNISNIVLPRVNCNTFLFLFHCRSVARNYEMIFELWVSNPIVI